MAFWRRRSFWTGAAIFAAAAALAPGAGADRALHGRRGARLRHRHGHRARRPLPAARTGDHQRSGEAPRAVFVLARRLPAAFHAGARGGQRVLRAAGRGVGLDVLVRIAPPVRRRRRRVRRRAAGVLAVERAVRRPRLEPERVPLLRGPGVARRHQAARAPRIRLGGGAPRRLPGAAAATQLGAGGVAGAGAARVRSRPPLEPPLSRARFRAGRAALHPARDPRSPDRLRQHARVHRRDGGRAQEGDGDDPLVPAEPDLQPPVPDAGRDVPRAVRLLGRPQRAGRLARAVARQPAAPVSPPAPAGADRVGPAAAAGRRAPPSARPSPAAARRRL